MFAGPYFTHHSAFAPHNGGGGGASEPHSVGTLCSALFLVSGGGRGWMWRSQASALPEGHFGRCVQIDASNNPWIAEGHVRVPRATWSWQRRKQRGHERAAAACAYAAFNHLLSQPHTDLDHGATPWVWAPSWGGSSLDESCFDGALQALLGPSRSPLNHLARRPPTRTNTPPQRWCGSRIVRWHTCSGLHPDFSGLVQGIFSPKVAVRTVYPSLHDPRAALRLGDHYTTFPQFKTRCARLQRQLCRGPRGGREYEYDLRLWLPRKPR